MAGRYCLASRHIADGESRVGLMYRERPFSDQDSGWRLFRGDEDGAFVADPANVIMLDLQDLCREQHDIVDKLSAPVGSAFERDDDGNWTSQD